MVSVSTDDALLDVERIHRWLSEDAYWARGRLLTSYGVRRAMLATADAHSLYAQHGFAPLADVERWMSRGYEQ